MNTATFESAATRLINGSRVITVEDIKAFGVNRIVYREYFEVNVDLVKCQLAAA